MRQQDEIYELEPSFEDDRPVIDFEIEPNASQDWETLNDVLDGKRRVDDYDPFKVVVYAADALDWDYYALPGTLGLISKRAFDVLRPYSVGHFSVLRANLNSKPYYLLMRKVPLDCLDRERSVLVPFPHDPTRIMEIKKYGFRKELIDDPLLFCIPELRGGVFATKSLRTLSEQQHLRGLLFRDIERL